MAIDAAVEELLVAEDGEWGDNFFDDNSVDLERFFDQALHMLDNEGANNIEAANPAQPLQQQQQILDHLALQPVPQPDLQPTLQNTHEACEGTSRAQEQPENQQNNMVSSTFLEEQRREMSAFLRKLGLRQATTDD